MKALLRTLLLWFLLAGVPLQGFAAATMLLCGQQAPAGAGGHEAMHADGRLGHPALPAAQHGAAIPCHDAGQDGAHRAGLYYAESHHAESHHVGNDHGMQPGDDASHDSHAQCASAGACCIGALLTPALPAAPPLQDGRCATVPFAPAAPAAVDLAGLERPPKSAPA